MSILIKAPRPRRSLNFFAAHRVFTRLEYAQVFGHDPKSKTVYSLLNHHVRAGRIIALGRGLFVSSPKGAAGSLYTDSFAIGARLREDAIFAYRSALELHGIGYSDDEGLVMVSSKTRLCRRTRIGTYQFVPPPKGLIDTGSVDTEVIHMARSRDVIRVTSLERTVVDVLHKPKLSGGIEVVIRSLDRISVLNVESVVAYTMLFNKSKLTTLVGWWLDRHRSVLGVTNDNLWPLRCAQPIEPAYALGAKPGDAVLMKPWQLLVPRWIAQLEWARRP